MKNDSRSLIENELRARGVPEDLVRESLVSYLEIKRRFYLSDFRPSAVEGGRFSEAVLRILEWFTTGSYTPLSASHFKADKVMNDLASISASAQPDSVRLHIPRTLRVIYDIRNKRNTAHLSDGISPNLQDSSLVVSCASWVVAELIRLFHVASPEQIQETMDRLVARDVPLIQVINDRPRILTDLRASDHVLVLMYWSDVCPVQLPQLKSWLPESMRGNARRTVNQLHDKHVLHVEGESIWITRKGEQEVVSRHLV